MSHDERRLKSVFGPSYCLNTEYIYNLVEETVEVNVETIVPVSEDRYQQLREKYILFLIKSQLMILVTIS